MRTAPQSVAFVCREPPSATLQAQRTRQDLAVTVPWRCQGPASPRNRPGSRPGPLEHWADNLRMLVIAVVVVWHTALAYYPGDLGRSSHPSVAHYLSVGGSTTSSRRTSPGTPRTTTNPFRFTPSCARH